MTRRDPLITHMTDVTPEGRAGERTCLLLVGADAVSRGRLANVLRCRGYEVVEAVDGTEGAAEFHANAAIACIILELASGRDGRWVVRGQHEDPRLATIPVLAFANRTDHSDDGDLVDRRTLSKADLIDELVKPNRAHDSTFDWAPRRLH